MASPAVIHPTMQMGAMDCVVASLSMLLGKSYREVAEAAKRVDPDALEVGLTWGEAVRVAKLLGVRLASQDASGVDLDELTGVLYVKIGRSHHAVVVFAGVIYNPADGMLYIPDAYFAAVKGKPVRLLVS